MATVVIFPIPRRPRIHLTDLTDGFRSLDPGVLTLFRRAYEERSRVQELPESNGSCGMVIVLAILLRQPIQASWAELPEQYAARRECGFDLFAQPFWASIQEALWTISIEKPEVFQRLEERMKELEVEYLPTHLETLLMWYYDNKSAHPFEGGR